jgi:methionyl aminopeptidase
MIPIKSESEIALMRDVCRIAANVLEALCRIIAPGISTYDLDQEGKRLFAQYGARSACFGYRIGNNIFPSHTCLSVNEEVVHGIGRLTRVLKEGDLISVDVCVEYGGFIGDNARTVGVGAINTELAHLLERTEKALHRGIACALSGNKVGAISNAIESALRPYRYGIIRDFVGHGVGRSIHEPPHVPNFGSRFAGPRLRPGMTLAIEPMVALGTGKVRILEDGWTAVTADQKPSAHFEHTVLVTTGQPEILTLSNLNGVSGLNA